MIEMLDLSNTKGVNVMQVTRVRYLVKVVHNDGNCYIYSFTNRIMALKNAFNVATFCRDCKVYFVRCLTV